MGIQQFCFYFCLFFYFFDTTFIPTPRLLPFCSCINSRSGFFFSLRIQFKSSSFSLSFFYLFFYILLTARLPNTIYIYTQYAFLGKSHFIPQFIYLYYRYTQDRCRILFHYTTSIYISTVRFCFSGFVEEKL